MSEHYQNNPLHSLKLEVLLTELVDFYGWEILAAALNFNCFKLNPSIKGSVKFFRKTEWARQKLEAFYLYRFKHLPRPDDKQFALPPRDRTIPEDQKPRDPVVLTLEELERINARKAANPHKPQRGGRSEGREKPNTRRESPSSNSSVSSDDPWANARKMLAEKKDDNS
jgi:uncharacterized protein (DUF2132 family)